MSSSVPTASGFTVVTQVFPQHSGTALSAPFTAQNVAPLLGMFLKGEPKALGTVQIIIGTTNILFGIVMAINPDSIGAFSGIVFWGGSIYIISGALSVAANNNPNRCLMKGSLTMNVFSTITASIATILFSTDLAIEIYNVHCESFDCRRIQHIYLVKSQGITAVMLVFSVLEFIISIYVSSFACRANVCACATEEAVFVQTQQAPVNTVTKGYLPNPTVNTYDIIYASNVGQSVLNNCAVVDINSETEPSKLQ